MAVKWCAHLWLYHRIVYIGIGTCSGKIAVKDNHTFKVPTGVKVVNAIIGGPSGLLWAHHLNMVVCHVSRGLGELLAYCQRLGTSVFTIKASFIHAI